MSLLDSAPSPGSYHAQPFTALEIDIHPDCDRIWATVLPFINGDSDAENAAVRQVVAKIERRLDAEIDRVIALYFNSKDPCKNAALRTAIRRITDEVYT